MDIEVVEYKDDGKRACFGKLKFTRDDNRGYYLSTGKINGKRIRLHVYVWEYHNGQVPDGYHVHHKDEDKNNNDLPNLELLSEFEHLSMHSVEQFKRNPARARRNLDAARIKASEWHKSEEGREVARKNFGVSLGEAMKVMIPMTCEQCGAAYETNKTKRKSSRFCSNPCKAKWRRQSGIDNVTKPCVICEIEFTSNKYDKSEACSPVCRGKLKTLRHLKR